MATARNQSGFTLIELLLYVAMVGVLLSAVTATIGVATDARLKNQTISQVNEQGLFVLESITQTVRNATSITTPAAAASGSSLTVVVPTSGLSPTIFSLSDTTLQIKEGTAAVVPLTTDDVLVTALSFKNLTRSGSFGVVQVSVTVSRVNTGIRNEFDYQRTFTTSVAIRP